MLQHIQDYWWAYWGMVAGIGWTLYQYRRTDSHLPKSRRRKSLIRGYDEHEGGIPPRRLLLVGIGLLVLLLVTVIEIIR